EEVCQTTQCGAELFIIDQDFTDSTAIPPRLDGCCPIGCQGGNSSDTLTFDEDCCVQCGDGVFDSLAGETCGEPNAPACPAGQFCGTTTCTCFPHCQINGQLEGIDGDSTIDEACDPQAAPSGCPTGQFCNDQCQCLPNCPHGVLDAREECAPQLTSQPNMGCPIAGQTCNNLCQCSSACGDGTIDPGEACEPPNTATCDANCQITVCGNGIVETGEECEGTTCNATINGEAIPGVCLACQCVPECQAEGSGCGDDGTGNTGVCFTGTGGT